MLADELFGDRFGAGNFIVVDVAVPTGEEEIVTGGIMYAFRLKPSIKAKIEKILHDTFMSV